MFLCICRIGSIDLLIDQRIVCAHMPAKDVAKLMGKDAEEPCRIFGVSRQHNTIMIAPYQWQRAHASCTLVVQKYVILVGRIRLSMGDSRLGESPKCFDLGGFCTDAVASVAMEWKWRRRESNPRPKAFSYSLYTCFSGENLHPPNLPGRARRMFAWFSFAYSSSRRGRMETIPHRDALHHHRGRVMGGRWPVIRRPGLLHNRWRLCGFPLFYEACGALGMQL